MKSATQLIEQIIRASTALHLRLAADRSGGKVEIGGTSVEDLIQEVDAGLANYERILVLFKNERAAEDMLASMEMDSEDIDAANGEPGEQPAGDTTAERR
ncbi:MAG: hypothetical protein R3D30_02075 [Hyphomicrobiales bacterium]